MFQTRENPFFRHLQENRVPVAVHKNDGSIQISVGGNMGKALDFIIENQLTDRALWAKFVQQFREKFDTFNDGWKGEYWGKMMRGAAFVYSVVRDDALYAILEETVRDLLTAQEENGRYSTYSQEHEFNGWDMWARKYVLLAMECFYPLCRNEMLKAAMVDSMKRHADYILDRVGPYEEGKLPLWKTSAAEGKFPTHGAMNSLSILEPIVLLYRLTQEQRYLDFSTYMVEKGVIDCGNIFEYAYTGERAPYQYQYTKAYELMSCFEGLMEYADVTGSEKWKQAAISFAYRLVDTDITVLGNAGTAHEFLNHSSVQQSIKGDEVLGQETCVAVTWMKLCARMLLRTGDPLFADCFEQSLYNCYLGTLNHGHYVNPEKINVGQRPGMAVVPTVLPFDSYTPLTGGVRGAGIGGTQQMSDGTYYGCCACIGSAGIGIAPHLVLMRAEGGFAFQLYEAGSYTAKTPGGQAVTFAVDTVYPADGTIRIKLVLETPEQFRLSLRIPSWSVESGLTVNGKAVSVTAGAAVLDRVFENGDELCLQLDMRVELLRPTPFGTDALRSSINWRTFEAIPVEVEEPADFACKAVLRRGPVVLAKERGLTAEYEKVLPFLDPTDCYLDAKIRQGEDGEYTVILPDGTKLKPAAAAGKTWNEDTAFTVWMETEKGMK